MSATPTNSVRVHVMSTEHGFWRHTCGLPSGIRHVSALTVGATTGQDSSAIKPPQARVTLTACPQCGIRLDPLAE